METGHGRLKCFIIIIIANNYLDIIGKILADLNADISTGSTKLYKTGTASMTPSQINLVGVIG